MPSIERQEPQRSEVFTRVEPSPARAFSNVPDSKLPRTGSVTPRESQALGDGKEVTLASGNKIKGQTGFKAFCSMCRSLFTGGAKGAKADKAQKKEKAESAEKSPQGKILAEVKKKAFDDFGDAFQKVTDNSDCAIHKTKNESEFCILVKTDDKVKPHSFTVNQGKIKDQMGQEFESIGAFVKSFGSGKTLWAKQN